MANEKKKKSTDDDAGKGAPNTGNSDTTQPTDDIKDDSKDKPADTAQADDSKHEPADTEQADKKSKIQKKIRKRKTSRVRRRRPMISQKPNRRNAKRSQLTKVGQRNRPSRPMRSRRRRQNVKMVRPLVRRHP